MNYISNWHRYLEKYSINKEHTLNLINELKSMYNENHRFYHNLHHIKDMYEILKQFKDKIENEEALFYATWFHDIVYDTKSSDNEEKSAEYARNRLSDFIISGIMIENVVSLILLTKKHEPLDISFDEKIFIDADLAIFGQERNIYTNYMELIRKEYSWVDDTIYNAGRINILNSFIKKDFIFLTDEFRANYESTARENILFEIGCLS